jgi:hypothetical protein
MGTCVSKAACCCRKPNNGVTHEKTDTGADAFRLPCRRLGALLLLFLAAGFPFSEIVFVAFFGFSSPFFFSPPRLSAGVVFLDTWVRVGPLRPHLDGY